MKVGSSFDVAERLRTYQTSSPFRDYALVDAVFVPDRRGFEHRFHEAMKGYRVGSTEWFQVHPQDAKNILATLKKELR